MLLCSWLIIAGWVLLGLLIFSSGLYWRRGWVLPVEVFAQLAGHAAFDDLPWLAVLDLFESEVDSLFVFGRWLYALVPYARELVCAAYDKWSRIEFCYDMHVAIDPQSNEN